MTAATRTAAACLQSAQHDLIESLLQWQRAKACCDQREAMAIVDDTVLDDLDREEHQTRIAARAALAAHGVNVATLADLA